MASASAQGELPGQRSSAHPPSVSRFTGVSAARARRRESVSSVNLKNGSRKKRLAYNLTCTNCRRRKTRCDGGQPGCLICAAYHEECQYDRPPPMSQVLSMAKRLQELESTVERLRTSQGGDLERALDELKQPQDAAQSATGSPNRRSVSFAPRPDGEPSDEGDDSTLQQMSEISANAEGQLSYYGPTSSLHQPVAPPPRIKPEPNGEMNKMDIRNILTNQALESRQWEQYNLNSAATQENMAPEMVTSLLKTHWTWIHPSFMFVYRPAFMRDMGSGGPLFSRFLLSTLCAHSTRFTQKHLAHPLLGNARTLVGMELQRGSSITAVQGLLQLSAREIGEGTVSQAWLYSGIAFRMGIDLGLFVNHEKWSNQSILSAQEQEIRKRLAWSCFLWDKAMSLYLGRAPALQDPPVHEPDLLDTSAETEIWEPYFDERALPSTPGRPEYPPQPAYLATCFQAFCKLSLIINDIILTLYSRRKATNIKSFLRDTRKRLDLWRANLPDHLKLDPAALPPLSPPPHILSENLVYFTTLILLNRPFHHLPACRESSREASRAVEALLLLFERTFGFSRITYIMSYCIYTAATVAAEDFKDDVPGSRDRVITYLRALEKARSSCPGIQRSIDIISESLGVSATTPTMASAVAVPSTSMANHAPGQRVHNIQPMPAFPYQPVQFDGPSGMQSGEIYMQDFAATAALDSFPMQFANVTDDGWYQQQF